MVFCESRLIKCPVCDRVGGDLNAWGYPSTTACWDRWLPLPLGSHRTPKRPKGKVEESWERALEGGFPTAADLAGGLGRGSLWASHLGLRCSQLRSWSHPTLDTVSPSVHWPWETRDLAAHGAVAGGGTALGGSPHQDSVRRPVGSAAKNTQMSICVHPWWASLQVPPFLGSPGSQPHHGHSLLLQQPLLSAWGRVQPWPCRLGTSRNWASALPCPHTQTTPSS